MKPFELVVYPQPVKCSNLEGAEDYCCELRDNSWDEELDWDMCPGCKWYWLEDTSTNKRLSNAQLAAEYWCSEWRCASPETTYEIKVESARRVAILNRFATLPHYDEEQK